jgi:hypothetical protein
MRMFACYKEIAKESKGICLAVMLRTLAYTTTLFDVAGDDPDYLPKIQEKIAPLNCHLIFISYFLI